MNNEAPEKNTKPDPITGAPGAHPIGVGIGAAGAAATGAAIGTALGGPVGTLVGGAVGAVAGGLVGKEVAEAFDPTAEQAYWRENHSSQPYAQDLPFDAFAPAYATGYEGYVKHSATAATFEDAEPHLQRAYETHLARASVRRDDPAAKAHLTWEKAKHASRAAWERVKATRQA